MTAAFTVADVEAAVRLLRSSNVPSFEDHYVLVRERRNWLMMESAEAAFQDQLRISCRFGVLPYAERCLVRERVGAEARRAVRTGQPYRPTYEWYCRRIGEVA